MRLKSLPVVGRSSQKAHSRRSRAVLSSVCVTIFSAPSSHTFTHTAQALQVSGLTVTENSPPLPGDFFSRNDQ